MLTKILFVALILATFSSQVLKGDTAFVLTTDTDDNSTLALGAITRARYGFMAVCIHKGANSTTNDLNFVAWFQNGGLEISRYLGLDRHVLVPTLQPNFDDIFVYFIDKNEKPIGYLYNSMEVTITLNRVNFVKKFGTSFFVTIGFATGMGIPNNNTNLDSIMEIYTYPYNISTVNPKFRIKGVGRRLEILNPGVYVAALLGYFALFIICLACSQSQPLKSRNIIPFLVILFQLLELLAGITHFVVPFQYYQVRCYLNILMKPLRVVLYALILINFLRYVSIISANKQKVVVVANHQQEDDPTQTHVPMLALRYRIMKGLNKWYVLIIVAMVVYVVFAILYMIPYAAAGFTCLKSGAGYEASVFIKSFRIFIRVMFGIIIGSTFCVAILDLILNLKEVISCGIIGLIRKDVFYFRIEIYIFGLIFMIWAGVWNLIKMNVKQKVLTAAIMTTIQNHLALFYQVIFVLLITIWQILRRRLGKKQPTNVLNVLLSNLEGIRIMEEFCILDWSVENISCWKDVAKYEQQTDIAQKKKLASKIYQLYLCGSQSELEVNIQSSVSKKIKEKMDTGEIAKNLYEDLKLSLTMNLSDTFSRLSLTQKYQVWQIQTQFLHDALEK